jgi:succinate-semialdehyde dehydrogenase/glutarate-semialdehyde dehydrogenase
VILADADLGAAAKAAADARLVNSGQSCIAAKRFIAEALAESLSAATWPMEALVWRSMDPSTDVSPLATEAQ